MVSLSLLSIIEESPAPYTLRFALIRNWYVQPLHRIYEKVHGLGDTDVSVISWLGIRNNLRAQDIVNISQRPKNSVSRSVAVLLRKGLVRREVDPSDRRQKVLQLTKRGREMYAGIVEIWTAQERTLLSALPKSETAALDRLLKKLILTVVAANRKSS